MKEHERRIVLLEDGQVNIEKTLGEQTKILARMEGILESNTKILNKHERRSLASETRLDILEKKDLKYKAFIRGAVWVFGTLGGLLATVWVGLLVIDKISKLMG